MLLSMRTALALGLFLVLAVSAIGLQGSTAALEHGSAARPHIVQDPIPFPARRKLQTRRYARRHYGLDTFRLDQPKVIVQHFTGSTSFRSAYNTFASNQPDIELHELPGLCAHFIVARDGTIHQLVSLSLMCRHTIGLNWTAVGIEHVGVSDRDILGNRRQLAASLRLTRWLQDRLGVRTRNVIGHAESLSSPYHHERIRALAHRTHGDFRRATMRRYRRLLERPRRTQARSPRASCSDGQCAGARSALSDPAMQAHRARCSWWDRSTATRRPASRSRDDSSAGPRRPGRSCGWSVTSTPTEAHGGRGRTRAAST